MAPKKKVNGVLKQYLINYVNIDQRWWGEHLGLTKSCHNFTMHLANKMSLFELIWGKKVRKPMDLTIPMGRRDHSKWAMEMVKGCEKLYTWTKKLLE
jgi:hypothetical protein